MRFGWLLAPAIAVASGVAWGLQFGREPFLLVPWVVLVPLFLLLARPATGRPSRRWLSPFLLGWLHGIASWLAAIPWIVPTVATFGSLSPPLALLGLVALSAYLGGYHAVFAALAARFWSGAGGPPCWWAPLLSGALWVALEWLRTYLISGFPWNLAGYAAVAAPGALPLTSSIGSYGLSFLLLAVNGGLALALLARRPAIAAWTALLCLLLLTCGGRWGRGEAVEAPGGPLPVRIIQPNIDNQVEIDPAVALANYRRLLELSVDACDTPGALLLWPESAAWPYSYPQEPILTRDIALLNAAGCPVLVNSPSRQPLPGGGEGWFNSAFLVGEGDAGVQRYDKAHLVPFGEYVPGRRLFPFFESLTRNAGDFNPAREPRLLDFRGERIGLSICFEVVFPAEVAERVQRGAGVLATVTNDAWYGDTAAPWQHFRAARFRAAENRRPLLRSAITGVSGVVAADGTVLGQLGVGEQGILRVSVKGRRDLSPFSRAPSLLPALATIVSLAWLVAAWLRRRRRRREGVPAR